MTILGNKDLRKGAVPFFLTIVVSFLFGLFLSQRRVIDPFLYYDLAFVKSFLGESLPTIPSTGPLSSLSLAPGRIYLLLALSSSLGMDSEVLGFLPIGSLLIAASFFILMNEITGAPWVSALATMYLCLNLSHATAIYSVFAYAFALPIFFAFVLYADKYSKSRSVKSFLILFLLFVALNTIHYTVASWAIFFLSGLFMIRYLQNFRLNKAVSGSIQGLLLSSLILIIVFLGFNQALYNAYIPHINPQTLQSAYERFLSYITLSPNLNTSPYAYIRPSSINLISTSTLLIIVVTAIAGFLFECYRILIQRKGWDILDDEVILLMTFILVGVADVVIYSFRGSISTKSISILFPISAFIFLKRLGKSWVMLMFSFCLLISSITKIFIFENESYVIRGNGTRIEDVQKSMNWLKEYESDERFNILADLNLYGKYLLLSGKNETPLLEALSQENYGALIGSKVQVDAPISADLVAIDLNSHQPALGFVWSGFKPIVEFTERIRSNPKNSILYDDGDILIGGYSSLGD
ncbi:MAG: hypothetical protein GTO14_22805 [Anaerolineales bacterium]|nr:hypothetical protein [Anaerolineales bacterium]